MTTSILGRSPAKVVVGPVPGDPATIRPTPAPTP